MKVINQPPPNYEEIKKHFPNSDFNRGVLFTYGDTCYCKEITPDLYVHEQVHTEQQTNPEEWWARYYIDPQFRLEQELEAYRAQWKYLDHAFKDRNKKNDLVRQIAQQLSGPLYNNIIDFDEALALVKQ